MILAILAAFEYVETNLAPFFGSKLRAGKGFYWTGIDASPAFPAGLIQGRSCFQGSIGQYGDEANPGAEAFSEEKTAFPDPTDTCQMGRQFVREDTF